MACQKIGEALRMMRKYRQEVGEGFRIKFEFATADGGRSGPNGARRVGKTGILLNI